VRGKILATLIREDARVLKYYGSDPEMDRLVESPSPARRLSALENGYGLDLLAFDRDPDVRLRAIARLITVHRVLENTPAVRDKLTLCCNEPVEAIASLTDSIAEISISDIYSGIVVMKSKR